MSIPRLLSRAFSAAGVTARWLGPAGRALRLLREWDADRVAASVLVVDLHDGSRATPDFVAAAARFLGDRATLFALADPDDAAHRAQIEAAGANGVFPRGSDREAVRAAARAILANRPSALEALAIAI